ncbi:MAG: right-handed parallel beta-helix repeat-containing protein, partial [Akkermansiaceae bacterium]|nr:right-handed parallel beta-helix repeat-containing protein [Armatimonadota bacterium]
MKILLLIGILSAAVCLPMTFGGAATRTQDAVAVRNVYYVATDGNDANSGTKDKPFRTIQKGVDACGPGETLRIRGGIYAEHVTLHRSGSYFGRDITITADTDAPIILDAKTLDSSYAVLDTGGQDHLIIRGITVKNAKECGIAVVGSWRVRLEKCHTSQTEASGIIVDKAHGVVVDGCEVDHACQKGGEESVTVKRSAEVTVQNCHVHDTGHEGIDAKEGAKHVRVLNNHVHHTQAQGLYADAWDSDTFDIRFEGNRVHDCMAGAVVSTESGGHLHDVWYVNNLIYDCRGPGMIVSKWGDQKKTHRMENIYFLNNTVVNNGHGKDHPTWGGGMLMENDQATNVVVVNNILSKNPDGQLRITGNLPPITYTAMNNLLDG